ncbi:MAG TPA: hypothetical protein DCL44_03070 [Elusimicrobia bacterium]|nr:hypothetical protein [Elusimicrobiota bacterium]
MKTTMLLLLLSGGSLAAGAEMTLKCEDLKPRHRTLKIIRMQPRLQDKVWLAGVPKTELTETCDLYGMKTGEAQYSQKSLQWKRRLVYKDREATKLFCKEQAAAEKHTPSFAEATSSSLNDFCRKRKKSDFDAIFVYDETDKNDGADNPPFKHIFRIYNASGFTGEEYFFDPASILETRKVYKYDSKNNLVETTELATTELGFAGNQVKRETFSFDPVTAVRTHAVYGRTTELTEKTVTEFREDSTLRRETRYTYDAGAQLVSKDEIYGSANGLTQKELLYQGDLDKPAYEYHYSYVLDSKGNWTEEWKTKFIVFNGKALPDTQAAPEITKREITYWEQDKGTKAAGK